MRKRIPDTLYHYCSVDTFVKIIQNKTLRLSEIAKSNDSMECQWLEKVLIPTIISNRFRTHLLTIFPTIDEKKERELLAYPEKMFNLLYGADKEKISNKLVFALCLSEDPDLLSQWRGYASDGCGIAVGFDMKLFQRFHNPSIESMVNFRKVIYSKSDQTKDKEKEIEKEINDFLKSMFSIMEDRGTDNPNKMAELNISTLYLSLKALMKSVYIKNDAFSEEKEWRLFVAFQNIDNYEMLQDRLKQTDLLKYFSELCAVSRSEKIVFYHDLNLNDITPNQEKLSWINKVYLGPKCKVSERDVRILLDSNSWDTRDLIVEKSSATYI